MPILAKGIIKINEVLYIEVKKMILSREQESGY
jgi:hypothetical protein